MPKQRGCGTRKENALYICIEPSLEGMPIEYFLIDPVIPLNIKGSLRAPYLLKDRKGINHLIMGVGASYYPYTPDFVEEMRVMGLSKRLPKNYDFSSLTPHKSQLLLVHPRAIPQFEYRLKRDPPCPRRMVFSETTGEILGELKGTQTIEDHACIGDLWDLSSVKTIEFNGEAKHQVIEQENSEAVKISTPSVTYEVQKAYQPDGETRLTDIGQYERGIFLRSPRFHFEYVNSKGKVPKTLERILTDKGFELRVVKE